MQFWVDVPLGWIFLCKNKLQKLLDIGFEHIELWKNKHIISFSCNVHSILSLEKLSNKLTPMFYNIFKTFHD